MMGTVHDITERKRDEDELKEAFDEIKKLKEQLEAENIYLREEVGLKDGPKDIIGVSNPLRYVLHRIQQVARTGTTVLLTGETGTGKGMFAVFLHESSDRRDKPYVKVNCAGLPPNLIESELFGREKGAFTGSTARQIGRFELAEKSFIVLKPNIFGSCWHMCLSWKTIIDGVISAKRRQFDMSSSRITRIRCHNRRRDDERAHA